jgi:hypothetical protein
VIVVLKDQFGSAIAGRHPELVRADEIKAAQRPLLLQLRAGHARDVRAYSLVDSFAATVSGQERARLAADPAVAKVIPDATIELAAPADSRLPSATQSATVDAPGSPPLTTSSQACSADQNQPQLEPEGLALTHVDSTVPGDQTARSLGFTGAGVKVGFIADGIDTGNVNLIRPDGNSVFSPAVGGDYQDFSGDGPGAATDGGEAFIDANTIAGQGLATYNVQDFSAQSDPTACWVRIEGVAPGASLVGLDVFGSSEQTTTSNFLEAIDYAVETDHVQVLNESFGGINLPDVTTLDAIKMFNDAAFAQGTFVTVAAGDGGPFRTIESPATDPDVMSVGASTAFRFYLQTNDAAARYFATSGAWNTDQISALSSAGIDEAGDTVDLVAPGDMAFASCDASSAFSDCTNFLGQPSDVEQSGGTSESAPFVAGAAALVIQAYRQTHAQLSPTPTQIAQILTSTASDIDAPAQEQGAGLLDAFTAVELAESIPGSGVTPAPVGATLLTTATAANQTGAGGQTDQVQLNVTNESAAAQTVTLSGRTFGGQYDVQSGSQVLADGAATFQNAAGITNNYKMFSFKVPGGASRLVAAISWPVNSTYCLQQSCAGDPNSRVHLILIDQQGDFEGYSAPQGSGSFGSVEVTRPASGEWTGYIFGADSADGGTTGQVLWRVAMQRAIPFGAVSPSVLSLAPGQSATASLTVRQPLVPGDRAGAIVLTADSAGQPTSTTSVPVTLRTLVNVSAGGSFAGALTGGNGRPNGAGQIQYYQFNVPQGTSNITANLRFFKNPGNPVAEYLIAPGGDTAGYGENSWVAGGTTKSGTSLSATALAPVAGVWTLIVDFAEPTAGTEIWQPYFGRIEFNTVSVHATGVPDSASTTLTAGTGYTAKVRITNLGAATEDYFIDPRSDQDANVTLVNHLGTGPLSLPLTSADPSWTVPTETSSVQIVNSSALPTMVTFLPKIGDPTVASSGFGASLCGTGATSGYAAPAGESVTAGEWYATPTECGPYTGPAPATTDSIAMTAVTKGFDTAVTSSTNDAWLGAVGLGSSFTPLVLAPGQSQLATVTFKPNGTAGTVVSGKLYIDDLQSAVPPPSSAQQSGDEVAAIPYTYTIG